jgi:diguanylate cyclase (GGDEF)-like protein/putative nucleotidyltransferase with HDIG domain
MNQLPIWLTAGLVLVLAALIVVSRRHRRLVRRLEAEQRQGRDTSELHLATLEALALAIDARDQTQHNHVRRVQVYATGLARALGMTADEVQAVRTAALLHDIGKLAVPEYILAKPGTLTAEEFEKVRIHAQVGADIVASVPFPHPVAPLIRSHHERWDGRGYPDGLAGEAIPLGARVLCVADHFESLTSERPYHAAITPDAAVQLLQQEAGKALDPFAVNVFMRELPAITADARMAAASPHPAPAVTPPDGAERGRAPAVRAAFANIALAHREIYGLYEIAQTMGTSLGVSDTMALISSKLSNLVPFSACALFVDTEPGDTLYCRFATGVDSELIQQLAIKSGQGLTGWVARNRRPLVNARPVTELEAAGSNLPTALQSALVCPLMYGERLIGTLAVYHLEPSFYRDDHRRLLDRVCEQAGAVIHNAIVFEQTQEASLTDPLTNLPNTRFMFMHLTRELARAERLRAEVSLLVMDLNDFKEINDTFGHHIGDRALREIARVLRATIRPYDICVRYAGDEFIVVLAGCGPDEAENKRVELREAVDRIAFEPRAGERLALAISAGAAVFPHDGDTYELLLAKADSRMYRDKSLRKREANGSSTGLRRAAERPGLPG